MNEKDYDMILREMTKPGSTYKMGSDMVTPRSIKATCLSPYGRLWNRFVISTLMPSTQQMEVTTERLYLLYCICSGKSINVGRLIAESINYIARGATSGGHGHASLITSLCKDQGVPMNVNEV